MESSDTEFSMLLSALGAAVAAVAVFLAQGWVRVAQRSPALLRAWPALLMAAAALAAGLTSALVLGMQAQAMAYPVGYRWWAAVLVPAAVLASLPVVMLVAGSARAGVLAASGALLALVALGLQAGWVWAAGFRPGVLWRVELVAAAAVLLIVGLVMAQWMAYSAASQDSPRRTVWRLGAGLLTALTLMAGQQVMTVAAGLSAQNGSLYSGQLSGAVLSLLCGVLVPLVLVALTLDLWLRHQQRRRRGGGDFNPAKRRKRRHKMRTL
jgi:hypothetical protein